MPVLTSQSRTAVHSPFKRVKVPFIYAFAEPLQRSYITFSIAIAGTSYRAAQLLSVIRARGTHYPPPNTVGKHLSQSRKQYCKRHESTEIQGKTKVKTITRRNRARNLGQKKTPLKSTHCCSTDPLLLSATRHSKDFRTPLS